MVEQEITNAAVMDKKVENERIEKEKSSTEKVLKIWSAGICIFLLIALFVIKSQNPEFPLVWVLIIGAVVIIISIFIFFSFNIFRYFNKDKDEDKKTEKGLPQPASLSTLRGLAEQALTNKHFNNHTTICLREWYDNAGRNKDRIYIYKTRALYRDNMKEGIVYIIINAHYPIDLRTVLIDPTPTELHKAINSLSSAPEDEPDTEETQVYNPMTNTIINTRKVEKPKHEEKKEEEKKEDLV